MKDKILRQMETVVHETMKSFRTDFFDHDKPRITGLEFKIPSNLDCWRIAYTFTCTW